MNEELFKLWIAGKSMYEISRMYSTKSNFISTDIIKSTAERFKWYERKDELLKDIIDTNNKQILIDKQKQLTAVGMMIDMNIKVIESAYLEYVKNPKKFFDGKEKLKEKFWMVNNIEDLKKLFEFYEKVIGGDKKIEPVGQNNQNSLPPVGINAYIINNAPVEIREKFYSMIKQTADVIHVGSMKKDNQPLLSDKEDGK